MRRFLVTTAAMIVVANTALAMPVSAKTAVGVDESTGATIYSVTPSEEVIQRSEVSAYNASQEANLTYIGTYDGIAFYSHPERISVSKLNSSGGYDNYTYDRDAITFEGSSGSLLTDSNRTNKEAVLNINTTYESSTKDVLEYLTDVYGLYGAYYISGGGEAAACDVFRGRQYPDGSVKVFLQADALLKLFQGEDIFESRYIPILQSYVSDGMSQKQTVYAVSQFVADTISYDYSVLSGETKNGIHCGKALEERSGVCHDYAEAFASLIRLIPFNNKSVVDWKNGTRNVLKSNIVISSSHAWNEIVYGGKTHYVDITWYDTGHNAKWLDMSAAEQADPSHTIIGYR